jgi:uncharacterized protein (DUF608 family)
MHTKDHSELSSNPIEKSPDVDRRNRMDRRSFLLAGSFAAASLPFIAGPFHRESFAAGTHPTHHIPTNKMLSSEWVSNLYKRGTPKQWRGDEFNTLGMPVGGIGAGQIYITGDGKLAIWGIFNQRRFNSNNRNPNTLDISGIDPDHGFAVKVTPKGKPSFVRFLNRKDFPNVTFIGEYPMARVDYRDDSLPVEIVMEAFSPFIPNNSADSALPATILEISLSNRSEAEVDIQLAGWLENPVGTLTAMDGGKGRRVQRVVRKHMATHIEYSGLPEDPAKPSNTRPPNVFEDFEGDSFGDWNAEGDAIGEAPAHGAYPNQHTVSGFKGEGLVNTRPRSDNSEGKLISPKFKIEYSFINFLIGGGRHRKGTFMRLMVEGEEVHRSTGHNDEELKQRFWNVRKYLGKTAHLEIVDAQKGKWGHINIDHIEFADEPKSNACTFTKRADYGTVSLALLGQADAVSADAGCPVKADNLFGSENGIFAQDTMGPVEYDLYESRCGALGKQLKLQPGETRKVTFALSWHFPIRPWFSGYHTLKRNVNEDLDGSSIGNYYTNRFKSASQVGEYIASNYDRLAELTRRYHHDFYEESTLPRWLLMRLGHTPSILATCTVHWRKNGRFWGWEGVGCCAGTCTHVWNYEQTLARLFPDLERTMREMQDLEPGNGLEPNGLINYRGDVTWEVKNIQYAADGQAGTVLKCYREHQMSSDNKFLKRNWLTIKKVLEYQITRDGNADGLIEDAQHTTYDVDVHGANSYVGSLYLAALRAAEEMAKIVGDKDFAKRCHKIFESGSKLTMERLFDGEYFIHESGEESRGDSEMGDGCLSDQIFGQSWAHQVGLGYIYPKDKVHSVLKSIYKYNWAPDVGPQCNLHRPGRWFARPGQAGLITCTWPKSEHLASDKGVRFGNEVWTGIEYQVAGHMIHEGMLEEGLAIIRGIHERHDGIHHNPYNEVECGDHYARAMASWGCLLTLSGFEYDGPAGHLGFAPRMNRDNFRSFFSTAEGWGSFGQKDNDQQRSYHLRLDYGKLDLSRLSLDGGGVSRSGKVQVLHQGNPIAARVSRRKGCLILRLDRLMLKMGETIEVVAHLA